MSSKESDNIEEEGGSTQLGPDEVFCTSCGEVIKEEAEVCPECGVRQVEESGGGDIPESRKFELQKIARKDTTTVGIVSFLIPFVGYIMVGKTGLALLNLFTLNYVLLGFIIVPIHTNKIIKSAREDLERAGESW